VVAKQVFYSFNFPLVRTRFVERPNRFLIRCALEGNDKDRVEAHLTDPGRLKELLVPGRSVWLRSVPNSKRKTQWSAVLCETPDGNALVSIDATFPNRLIVRALEMKALEEFSSYASIKAEYTVAGSRWDFLLEDPDKEPLLIEVKSVTLVENGIGLFPDAVTARGAKHVRTLSKLIRERRYDGAILFVVQREDAKAVKAAEQIDPAFASALEEARQAGVRILGRLCNVSLEGISLGEVIEAG